MFKCTAVNEDGALMTFAQRSDCAYHHPAGRNEPHEKLYERLEFRRDGESGNLCNSAAGRHAVQQSRCSSFNSPGAHSAAALGAMYSQVAKKKFEEAFRKASCQEF